MKAETVLAVVKKLIGPISPVGESNADKQRLDNTIEMCELLVFLKNELDLVIHNNSNAREASVKKVVDHIKDVYKDHLTFPVS